MSVITLTVMSVPLGMGLLGVGLWTFNAVEAIIHQWKMNRG
jgi:hypothetical protein